MAILEVEKLQIVPIEPGTLRIQLLYSAQESDKPPHLSSGKTCIHTSIQDHTPPDLFCKQAKDLCPAQCACLQKITAYKCQHNAHPYHVLLLEPRLLHDVFVHIFYPKGHSKKAYNELALEAIYRIVHGWKHITDLTLEEASALKVPHSDPPSSSSRNLIEHLVGLKEDQAELRNQLDHI
ncbi:hypothetical protein Cgig2_027791 [Carnegiea gigantea]|uniref:Uncharacterized protein n=1 Tax=Carnegiea gigantea TaxID=171969 RepID=A0A9Q1JKX2_9CARY|nr:hypothetical protein Cgig2_027791 [Carnegiea gigantea]